MADVAVLGIDLGKNSCSVVGWAPAGELFSAAEWRGTGFPHFWRRFRPPWWRWRHAAARTTLGRGAESLGHRVRLMPPEYVRPYAKAQKNDDRDAEAIAEAATRPTMLFVPLKAEAQLDVQAGLPVGLQLIGPMQSEERLFDLAAEFEAARP